MFVSSSDKYSVDAHTYTYTVTRLHILCFRLYVILILKYNAWFMRQLSLILGSLLCPPSNSLTLDSNGDRTPSDWRKKLQTVEPQKLQC
jgi:hypothetical protein